MAEISRAQWGALPPKATYPNGVPVDVVYVHHDAGHLTSDPYATIRSEQRDHMYRQGWLDLAYQKWIAHTGDVFDGRGFTIQDGATGCQGGVSLSICLQGNFENVLPTRAQINALVDAIVDAFRDGYLTDDFEILPHNEAPVCPASWTSNTNATLCCGKHLIAKLPEIRERVSAELYGDPPAPPPLPDPPEGSMWLYFHDESTGTEWVQTDDGTNRFYGPAALKFYRDEEMIPSSPLKVPAATAQDFYAGGGHPPAR